LSDETVLLALDCIDFRPEFCYIDTLSDIAMLAIDIELYVANTPGRTTGNPAGKALAAYFLESYLEQAQEQHSNVWRLLKYYMLEKAMIGTYGSILNDKQIEVGKQYFYLAYRQALDLRRLL
jgi:aminoglycoside phosphotransferase family enzyme